MTTRHDGARVAMRLVRITALFAFCLSACSTPLPSGTPGPTPTSPPTSTALPSASPTVGLATFEAPNFTFTYPADWNSVDVTHVLTLGGSQPIALVANFPLVGCSADDINCLFALKVPRGGLLVSVGIAHKFVSIFDPGEHWTETLDRMPARTMSRSGYLGIDENRDWIVAVPGGIWGQFVVEASIRGPGLAVLDGAVDAIARSVRFDIHPPPLDPSAAAAVLAASVSSLDKPRNFDLPTASGCFPRTAGERPARLRTWWSSTLPAPVPVTCASAIEPTAVDLWRVTLSVRWAAGARRVAGSWREDIYFDARGIWIGRVQLTPNASPLGAQ